MALRRGQQGGFVSSLGDQAYLVLLLTLVQKRTPTPLRGRVFGLLATIRQCLTPLGAATFGILIDRVHHGVTQVLFWSGVAGIVTAAAFPGYRHFFSGGEEEVAG